MEQTSKNVVKLVLGAYVKKQGQKVNSGALIASGSDATFDAVLSASVLASAIIYLLTGISLEAYVGVVISVVIIKAGIEMMRETLDDILGKREDAELITQIKHLLCEEPLVKGAYDLTMYDYGPNKRYGTVHLELPDTMTVSDVDAVTRRLQAKVYGETGVVLTGIGVYSHNTTDEQAAKIEETVRDIVMSHEWALQMHGFYVDREAKILRFDVVVSFDISREEAYATLLQELQPAFPDYELQIVLDADVSD